MTDLVNAVELIKQYFDVTCDRSNMALYIARPRYHSKDNGGEQLVVGRLNFDVF